LKHVGAEVLMLKRSLLWMALAMAAATGCDDKVFDCLDICSTRQACIAVDIDVTDCSDRCDDFASQSDANANRVESCNECLDARVCSLQPQCAALCDF
jgi:hypothetical protein